MITLNFTIQREDTISAFDILYHNTKYFAKFFSPKQIDLKLLINSFKMFTKTFLHSQFSWQKCGNHDK